LTISLVCLALFFPFFLLYIATGGHMHLQHKNYLINFFSLSLLLLCITTLTTAQINWQQISGQFGTSVPTLTFSGTDIFAGTVGSGVIRSTDNGISWSGVNNGITSIYAFSFAVNGTNLFTGTSVGGVFLSTNNGASWNSVSIGSTMTNVRTLTFSGTNLFAGTDGDGIFLSTNNGTSWSAVNTGLTNTCVFTITVIGTNLFAATNGGGVFLSTNNGTSWSAVNTGLTNQTISTLTVSGTNLFAGTWGYGIFLSTNNGTSWSAVNTGLTNSYIYTLLINGTDIFAGTWGGGVFLSTNNGTSWSEINTGLTNNNVQSLAINGTSIFAGTDGGSVFFSQIIQPPPSILSFAPTFGPIGTTVTITGKNFNPITANNIAYFGAVKATVTSATSTSLNVTAPASATYAPITVTNLGVGLTAFSNKPFVVTFPSSQVIDATSFTAKIDFTTGMHPQSATIGDIDGDGKPDLIIANQDNASVSVFRNTSTSGSINSSSFTSKIDFPTGSTPTGVAIGDLDGDGKPDLVITNEGDNTISVLKNISTSGSITANSFAAKVSFTTGNNPRSVAINDIDGDGKPDLIVGNLSSNYISVFRNTSSSGSITTSSFASKVDFTTGSNPGRVAISDVDGDGKPDVVVGDFYSNTVSIFRNTSDSGSITASSLAPKVDFMIDTPPYNNITLGDVDGDGKPDLVVTNYTNSSVSVFRNTSTAGSITASSFASRVDFTTGTNPWSAAIGDINGDGKPELIVTSAYSGTVSVFRNTSTSGSITTGSFASKVDFTAGSGANSVAICDVDGDGKSDIVVGNYSAGSISVLRNMIISESLPPTITSFFPTRNARNLDNRTNILVWFNTNINQSTLNNSTIKVNGSVSGLHTCSFIYESSQYNVTISPDYSFKVGEIVTVTLTRGIKDLAGDSLASSSSWQFTIKTNTASAIFTLTSSLNVGNIPYAVVPGDFNGDGYIDLAVANAMSYNISILLNNGNGTFSLNSSPSTGDVPVSEIAGDFNEDGNLDLAVSCNNGIIVECLLNNGNGTYTHNSTAGVDNSYTKIVSGDFNGDGVLDLAVMINGVTNIVSIFLNNGSGIFTQSSTIAVGGVPTSITSGDFNGDGAIDLAVADFSNTVKILMNDGNGIFTQSSSVTIENFLQAIAASDFNGDGFIDLAVARSFNDVAILLNNGNGIFTLSSTVSVGNLPTSLTTGDLNGDGYIDIAVVNQEDKTVSILLNNGSGIFTPGSTQGGLGNLAGPVIIAADFNGDGALDLAVVNNGSNTVSILINSVSSSDVVSVAGSTFQMGSYDANDFGASPPHSVTLDSFKIDKYEITFEKWTEVRNWALTHGYASTDIAIGNAFLPIGTNSPAGGMNWYDILKWCNACSEKDGLTPVYYTRSAKDTVYRTGELDLTADAVKWTANGYRLPTEAEWEFAARGGNQTHGYTYSGSNMIGDVAWYYSNSGGTTHQVGTKSANELGIYDMSGNVSERCWDWYGTYDASSQINPKGSNFGTPYRVVRGGSFASAGSNDDNCRVAYRTPAVPAGGRYDNYGFRCASTILQNHVSSDLVAYYPFNGNANDASGNGNNGIFISATPTFDRFGKDSSAFNFNGVDNYIDFGDVLDDVFCKDTAQFTISGWAKTKVMGDVNGEGNVLIGKTAGGTGPYQWHISHNSGMLFGCVFSDSTVNNYQQKYMSMGTDEWFHFVLIFDGKQSVNNRIRIFVNNTSDMHYWSGSGTLGTSTKNTSLHMYVGGQTHYFPTLQSRYNGILDDIRIYNKVLSVEEINALYHEGGWDITNNPPLANAGPDRTVYTDSLSNAFVTLDGSASSDIDGDTLVYTWKQANTTLATDVRPIIQLPLGSHTITLIVADGKGGIDTDQVVINVKHSINGLVAHYPFNGNANDESGNGYNATFINATPTIDRFGKDSSAFYFNGIDNYIDFGDILDETFCKDTAQFTVSGWAKTAVMGTISVGNVMIGKTAGGIGPYQWGITHNDGMLLAGVFSDSTVNNYQMKYVPMGANQWFHFVLIFDGKQSVDNRIRVFVNNRSDMHYWKGSGTLGTSTKNTSLHMYVGGQTHYSSTPQSLYNGVLDDIRIYKKVLSVEEINTLYHEGSWDTTTYNEPRIVFSTNVEGPVYAGISILRNDVMYAIASGDAVYRMNTTGSIVYTLQVAGEVRSASSIAHDNIVYIASSDRNLYAFTKDGNSAWPPLPMGGMLTATPVIDSSANRLYIGVSNHNFIAVNRSTGTVVWSYFTDDQIKNSAVMTGDRKLVFATQKGTLYGFDLKKNSSPAGPTWQIALPDTAPSSFAVDNKGNIYLGTGSGILLKVALPAKKQPEIIWQTNLGHSIVSAPVIDAKGILYVGSTDSKLYAVDISSGVVKWSFTTSGPIRSTPAISNLRKIFVANDNGEVYSLDSNKVIRWYYKTDAAIVSPLLYYNSTLFFGTLGNKVIALYDSSQSSVLTKSSIAAQESEYPMWSTFQGDGQRTGMAPDFTITGIGNDNMDIPANFALSQNYPNPFNPSTTIRYELPIASRIFIKVYNVIGQEVMVLKNGFENAGYHEITFENSSLPSGIYFYQMRAGSFFETKKMILMK
jgi:formylglycine-generating enzyme required for sulfatase activity